MSAETRRGRPGQAAPSSTAVTVGEQVTPRAYRRPVTVPADDPIKAAVELLEALGPSTSMALVAELARLVVDIEPVLVPPMRFLLEGVLS